MVTTGPTLNLRPYVAGVWTFRLVVEYQHESETYQGPYLAHEEQFVTITADPTLIFGAGFEYGTQVEFGRVCSTPTPHAAALKVGEKHG